MPNVFFYEVFQEEERALKRTLPKTIRAGFTRKTIQEAKHKNPPSALISIRTQSVVFDHWAPQIKGILTRSQGYDHVLAYCQRINKKIPCGYLADYCSRAVAEQAILMTTALLRKLPRQISHFKRFDRDGLTGREVSGRNLLVVGVGGIGSEIVDLGRSLKMNVKGVDLKVRFKNLDYVTLTEGIRWAEVMIAALPLTRKTNQLLSYSKLKKARPGLILVNVGRGEVTPLKDLDQLLKEGVLGGLGLDVFENEPRLAQNLRSNPKPPSPDDRIVLQWLNNDRCLLTPHNAFNTVEAVEKKARESVGAVQAFLKKGKFPHPVPNQD